MKAKDKTNNQEIKIESGIPIPAIDRGKGKWKSVLLSMKDGDSFTCTKSSYYCVRQTAHMQSIAIIARSEGDGVRVWKTGMKKPA